MTNAEQSPENRLSFVDKEVKGPGMGTARTKGQVPKGWAAARVEAGEATEKVALAKNRKASARERMVDAVESMSNSLRILAEAAAKMMLDDSDDEEGDEEAF